MVVVGAGLAGLRAAGLLVAGGRDVVVLESEDRVGGRVRTDRVDGFTLDRGFQVYNPAYPEGRSAWPDLELCQFAPGVDVVRDGASYSLSDPRRDVRSVPDSLRALRGLGTVRGAAALAAYVGRLGSVHHPRSFASPQRPIGSALLAAGVDEATMDAVVRPFLAGVLADEDLVVPRGVADPILRTFAAGTPGVPAGGMDVLPRSLAEDLDVVTGVRALHVEPARVVTDQGEWLADDVIVAVADPSPIAPRIPPTRWRSLTTWYFSATALPAQHVRLILSPESMLANVAVLSDVAPSYAPPGRVLVAASACGYLPAEDQAERARSEAALVLGIAPGDLELIASYPIAKALPSLTSRPEPIVRSGLICAGDHRLAPSINGALATGRRAAELLLGG